MTELRGTISRRKLKPQKWREERAKAALLGPHTAEQQRVAEAERTSQAEHERRVITCQQSLAKMRNEGTSAGKQESRDSCQSLGQLELVLLELDADLQASHR